MPKHQTDKSELSPAGCVFSGVPEHKLKRMRALLRTEGWRNSHTQPSVGMVETPANTLLGHYVPAHGGSRPHTQSILLT